VVVVVVEVLVVVVTSLGCLPIVATQRKSTPQAPRTSDEATSRTVRPRRIGARFPTRTPPASAISSLDKVVVTKGVEVTTVAHAGRSIPAHLRTAVEARDPKCIVPTCDIRRGLEIDHRAPWTPTRDTGLANLARLCHLCGIPHNQHYADRRIMPTGGLGSSVRAGQGQCAA
jgi:hypothetical protein